MDADRQVDAWRRLPLGIRWNNPGNLRPTSVPWLGEGNPYNNYCTFDTPEHGLRAMAKDLLAKYDRHALVTIRGIICRYAPPEDNNDTLASINAVWGATGFAADDRLSLHDPPVLRAMLVAMIRHENGQMPYADAQID